MLHYFFCVEACPVVLKATSIRKVDGNEKWQMKSDSKNREKVFQFT